MHDTSKLKDVATTVAADMKKAGDKLPPELRQRFIAVRSELFQRGIYDPVLVRFDTITVPRASTAEVAEQLAMAAASL